MTCSQNYWKVDHFSVAEVDQFYIAVNNMALKGNEAMLRLFLERMLPAKPNDEPVQINIPDCGTSYTQAISYIGKEALQAVTSGVITPNDAGQVASLIGAHARLITLVELNQKMDALIKDNS